MRLPAFRPGDTVLVKGKRRVVRSLSCAITEDAPRPTWRVQFAAGEWAWAFECAKEER